MLISFFNQKISNLFIYLLTFEKCFLNSDRISFVFVHVVLLERRMSTEATKLVICVLQMVKNQVKINLIDLL